MTPLVDIAIATYNHEKFIARAIEGVLGQKTEFKYRLIIGDDCSQDRTQEIVRSYSDKYPDRIKTILDKIHLGVTHKNRVGCRVLEACTAKYIAMLDGDDYWISDQKLQKQITLLENNPHYAGCFSNAIVVDDSDHVICDDYFKYHNIGAVKSEITTPDIVPFGISPCNTMLFRRDVLRHPPDWFTRNMRHSGFDLLITLHGVYRYMDEKLGAYRVHTGGVWSLAPLSQQLMNNLSFLKPMYHDAYMKKNHGEAIRRTIEYHLKLLWTQNSQDSNFLQLLKHLATFCFAYPAWSSLSLFAVSSFYSKNLEMQRGRIALFYRRTKSALRDNRPI